MSVSAILLSGGLGTRMGAPIPKQYLPLAGKPVVFHSFDLFLSHPKIQEVIVVCKAECNHFFTSYPKAKITGAPSLRFALPGPRRQDSVFNGLQQVSSGATFVCIHDGARPLLSPEDLNNVILSAERYGAASLASPIKNTLKLASSDGFVSKTIDREGVWEVYTPQVARISLIRQGFAIANTGNLTATDDNFLIELTGHPVKLVDGDPSNIKITTPEDLFFASCMKKRNKSPSNLAPRKGSNPLPENDQKMTYRMTIAYDGTNYGGWQIQANAPSVQGLIEKALSTILQQQIRVIGSGRTDAGVHATGQVAHFSLNTPIPIKKTLSSVNGILPLDIRILTLELTNPDFHARYHATSKTYHYHLHLNPIPNPFSKPYAYHVPHPVCLLKLQDAASYFIGTHDFTSFTNVDPKRLNSNGIRTLYRLSVVEEPNGARLEFEGNGFLYKMVRNIVGTLLDVCSGKIPLSDIEKIFSQKDRRLAGESAPPHGLFLVEVKYTQ